MYQIIIHHLKQGEHTRAELSEKMGCNHPNSLHYYLATLHKHSFVTRTGHHYQLASNQPLLALCSRCKREILTWARDNKGRCTTCHPKNTLKIVDKIRPPRHTHSTLSQIMQRPFTTQAVANLYNKEQA